MTRLHHYEFCHQTLRQLFFEAPEDLILILDEAGSDALAVAWHMLGDQLRADGEPTMSCDGISVEIHAFTEHDAFALVEMPALVEELEAYFVALVVYEDGSASRYITLEHPSSLAPVHAQEVGLLCEWTKEGSHLDPGLLILASKEAFINAMYDYLQSGGGEDS